MRSDNTDNKKSLSIKESFDELEKILSKMEDENTGLEDSFKLYEEGMKLVKAAESSIDKVEKEIKRLSDNEL